jgi:hypothetical protein
MNSLNSIFPDAEPDPIEGATVLVFPEFRSPFSQKRTAERKDFRDSEGGQGLISWMRILKSTWKAESFLVLVRRPSTIAAVPDTH